VIPNFARDLDAAMGEPARVGQVIMPPNQFGFFRRRKAIRFCASSIGNVQWP